MIIRARFERIANAGGLGSFFKRGFAQFRTGQDVTVDWKGIKWDAVIKDVSETKCLVSYKYSEEPFEEWIPVSSSRIVSRHGIDCKPNSAVLSQGHSRCGHQEFQATPHFKRKVMKLDVLGYQFLSTRLRNGKLVIQDPSTGLLSWSIPSSVFVSRNSERDAVTKPPKSKPKEVVADGFLERKDTCGETYFFNTVNNKAQYARPRLSAQEVADNMSKSSPKDALPAQWELYFDEDGVAYYLNVDTGRTVRTIPKKPAKETDEPIQLEEMELAAPQDCEPVKLEEKKSSPVSTPDGWELHYTEDGSPYYYCQATGESRWELPEEMPREEWWEPEKQIRLG